MERAAEDETVVDGGGLLGGLMAHHLRMLCESEWNGGGGYTPEEVGRMTLDQIWFRLCDVKILERDGGGGSVEKVNTTAAIGSLTPDKYGMIRGRAADGTPILARVRGKSLAQELTEREEGKRRKAKRRGRRKGKG